MTKDEPMATNEDDMQRAGPSPSRGAFRSMDEHGVFVFGTKSGLLYLAFQAWNRVKLKGKKMDVQTLADEMLQQSGDEADEDAKTSSQFSVNLLCVFLSIVIVFLGGAVYVLAMQRKYDEEKLASDSGHRSAWSGVSFDLHHWLSHGMVLANRGNSQRLPTT